MKLEDILADLEKQAGFPEDLKKDENKDEDKEEGKKDESGKKEDEKNEGKKDEAKKEEKDQEKSAAFKSGSDLAKEIMEKVASTKIQQINKDEEMNKQASDAGKALAQALLTKLAGVGDQNTENGIPEGVVPNKTQVDLAAQKAEHDQSFQATPGTDGAGNGGTINEIFDAIVADAAARGAVVEASTAPQAALEGAENDQAPNQVQVDESQEKMAAAIALVNSGIDFDTAIDLVKSAAAEIEFEEDQQIKQAAMNELLDAGVDFELAAAMVKQASKLTAAKQAVGNAVGLAHAYGTAAKETVKATAANAARKAGNAYGTAHAYGTAAKEYAKATGQHALAHIKANPKAYAAGAAGAAALGGGAAYALGREKKAAVDMLIENGVDFDTAVDLVNAKADEIYGG